MGQEFLVGRYELRGLLGAGGMAEVWDGWDHRLQRAVAVKLLHRAVAAHPDLRRRFENEARAAAGLSHPNIVAIHDFGEHAGTPFLVMERLPGQSLADLISREPLPPPLVRAALADVLAALAVAHHAGVLHRDIKPGNILTAVTGDSVKVADFGIAKVAGDDPTMAGQVLGTVAYMSPERIAGAPASVSDDLYAVGVMGYEALTGRRAYPPPPPLGVARPDIDPALAGVIDRAMAHDPRQRFGRADEMRSALAAMAPPRPATLVLTEHPPAPPRRLPGRTRTLLGAAAIIAAFVVAIVAFTAGSSNTREPVPVDTGTSVPAPTSAAPPPPAVAPPPPLTADEKPPKKKGPGNGKGNGHGHGKGKED
ncbi:serine/threonine-protein kinase [Mycobacterium sp. NPDC003449]